MVITLDWFSLLKNYRYRNSFLLMLLMQITFFKVCYVSKKFATFLFVVFVIKAKVLLCKTLTSKTQQRFFLRDILLSVQHFFMLLSPF
jgi:hypothetical protein